MFAIENLFAVNKDFSVYSFLILFNLVIMIKDSCRSIAFFSFRKAISNVERIFYFQVFFFFFFIFTFISCKLG